MKNRGSIVGGLILILVGALFLLLQAFPNLAAQFDPELQWPLLIVAVGVLFLLGALLPFHSPKSCPSQVTKQPTTHRDRSQARDRLPIFHATLLGELRLLQRGLRRCYASIYSSIIAQIETSVKFERAVFFLCYFKRHLTDELGM